LLWESTLTHRRLLWLPSSNFQVLLCAPTVHCEKFFECVSTCPLH
jgi:hypothetical protein